MAEDGDPIRDVTFRPGTLQVRVHHPRRVGRPKLKWAPVETERMWEQRMEGEVHIPDYNDQLPAHQERLLTLIRREIAR